MTASNEVGNETIAPDGGLRRPSTTQLIDSSKRIGNQSILKLFKKNKIKCFKIDSAAYAEATYKFPSCSIATFKIFAENARRITSKIILIVINVIITMRFLVLLRRKIPPYTL